MIRVGALPLDFCVLRLFVSSIISLLSSGCAVGLFVLFLLVLFTLSLFSNACALALSFSYWFFNNCACLCFVKSFLIVSAGVHVFLCLLHALLSGSVSSLK